MSNKERLTSTIRHNHKFCPCVLCNQEDTIEDGLVMCIIDDCFFQKRFMDLTPEQEAIETLERRNKQDLQSAEKITCYICEKEIIEDPIIGKLTNGTSWIIVATRNYCSIKCATSEKVERV